MPTKVSRARSIKRARTDCLFSRRQELPGLPRHRQRPSRRGPEGSARRGAGSRIVSSRVPGSVPDLAVRVSGRGRIIAGQVDAFRDLMPFPGGNHPRAAAATELAAVVERTAAKPRRKVRFRGVDRFFTSDGLAEEVRVRCAIARIPDPGPNEPGGHDHAGTSWRTRASGTGGSRRLNLQALPSSPWRPARRPVPATSCRPRLAHRRACVAACRHHSGSRSDSP